MNSSNHNRFARNLSSRPTLKSDTIMSFMCTVHYYYNPEYIIFFKGLYFLSIGTVGSTNFFPFSNAKISENLPNESWYKTIQLIWPHFNRNSNNFFRENKFDNPSKIYLRFQASTLSNFTNISIQVNNVSMDESDKSGEIKFSSVILLHVKCDPTKTDRKSFKTIRMKRFQTDRPPTDKPPV